VRYRVTLCLFIAFFSHLLYAADEPPSGAQSFERCATCHLATGEGIPGAFPPLKGRIADIAASAEGRAYLIAVVNTGLMGSITVEGIPYMGVMPAQGAGYDADGIRDALNYAVQTLDAGKVKPQWQPFTSGEVETVVNAEVTTSSTENARLRQALLSKYSELQ